MRETIRKLSSLVETAAVTAADTSPRYRMRLARILRYTVFLAFFTMISLSAFIFLDFLPDFEAGQFVALGNHQPGRIPRQTREIMVPKTAKPELSGHNETFRENYKHLYDSVYSLIGKDYIKDKSKYLIYRCDTSKLAGCDDWADHVKGMEAAYLIANLTGRVFKAELYGFPCLLSDYMNPNSVNWSSDHTFHPTLKKGMAGLGIRNFDNNHHYYTSLYKVDLKEIEEH